MANELTVYSPAPAPAVQMAEPAAASLEGVDAYSSAIERVDAYRSADRYKTDGVLAALKKANDGADVRLPDGFVKDFNQWAHGAKLSQAQYESAFTSYLGAMESMVDRAFDHAMAKGRDELVKVWGPQGVDPKGPKLQAAHRAFMEFAPPALRNSMDLIGSHPVVLQILAAVGERMSGGQGAAAEDIGKLMDSEPYWNKRHPEHTATVSKVNDFFVRGGVIRR